MGAIRDAGPRSRRRLSGLRARSAAPGRRRGWTFRERVGTPTELVVAQPATGGRRLASFCRPTAPAVVIGSTQDPAEIDDERREQLGYELVKRRSGGGAVIVAPAAQAWVDLFVPRDDPLYVDDVGRAAHWVAELWSAAIEATFPGAGSVVPIRRHTATVHSRAVCFSGLGPGEVTVDGGKVVGVSQRRGRDGAWFFTMALCRNDQRTLAELLALDDPDREALAFELTTKVGVIAVNPEVLEDEIRSLLSVDAC